jgi:peptidoglycan L-alanyl-D-glutamate endopeptidase CwlK
MDPRSESNLAHVHPDLAKVARAASQSPQPFVVDYGIRTLQAEAQAVATGHSQTMHSRHLPDANFDNLAMAFDFFVVVDGQPSFTVADDAGGAFGVAARQILEAAQALGVKVQWGGQAIGAWVDGQASHWRDWGHIQLDPSAYR